jgi:hypothetical protein
MRRQGGASLVRGQAAFGLQAIERTLARIQPIGGGRSGAMRGGGWEKVFSTFAPVDSTPTMLQVTRIN